MSTRSHRMSMTFKPKVIKALNSISKKNDISLSQAAQELIEEALKLREDVYLSRLADEVEERAKGKKSISADKLWKDLAI